MKIEKLLMFLLVFSISINVFSQPAKQLVQVNVSPDNADWNYKTGDRAEFRITVMRNNVLLDGLEVSYSIQPELMKPLEQGKVTLKKGEATVKAKPFKEPEIGRAHV